MRRAQRTGLGWQARSDTSVGDQLPEEGYVRIHPSHSQSASVNVVKVLVSKDNMSANVHGDEDLGVTYLQVYGYGSTSRDSHSAAAGPCSTTERLAATPPVNARQSSVLLVPRARKSKNERLTVAGMPG